VTVLVKMLLNKACDCASKNVP